MFAVGIFIVNEARFAGYAVRSLLASREVDVIAVVEGCTELNAPACTEDGLSRDNTADVIWDTIDKYDTQGRVKFDRFGWAKGKRELQNRTIELSCQGSGADWYLLTAGDELWDAGELNWLAGFLRRHKEYQVVCPTFYHFWHRETLRCVGSAWSVLQARFFKIHKGMHFAKHNCPPVGPKGGLQGKTLKTDKIHVFHYTGMQPDWKIENRLALYQKRDGHRLRVRNLWASWDFEKWKKGIPQETQWTHSSGSVVVYDGPHPEVIAKDLPKFRSR